MAVTYTEIPYNYDEIAPFLETRMDYILSLIHI